VDTYDESIRYVDSQVGALVDSLGRRGLLDNTLLIITSDHGESWGQHGLMFHGHSLYRDVTHVPLIVRLPGRTNARREKRAVGLDQIPATIASIAGFAGQVFPATSLLDSARRDVVLQLARRTTKPGLQPASRSSISSLVTDEWQYIEPHDGTAELFHLGADPKGLLDVSRVGHNPSIVSDLRERLKAEDAGRTR
jgi:arylsulfatase A-like enzyme